MNEEEMMAQAQGGAGDIAAQNAQMLQQIGQLVQENNQMLQQLGQMMQQAMGMEQQEAGGGGEEALRQEAMARLAQQQGA